MVSLLIDIIKRLVEQDEMESVPIAFFVRYIREEV
jgi:hypothetical protein